jgi:hypothetical protein
MIGQTTLPRFTDLKKMSDELSHVPAYRRLAKAIRKSSTSHSCVGDLAQAQTSCDALDELLLSPRKAGTLMRSATENALLMNAVLLYARATVTGSGQGERGSISIAGALNVEQANDHGSLVAIRNRAIAHVHLHEAVGEKIWHEDRLFAVETDEGWKAGGIAKSLQFDGSTLARLKRQIPVARLLITRIFQKHLGDLTIILNSNPVPIEIFERHLFDPVAYMGSQKSVREAIEAIPRGWAAGLM